MKTKAHFDSLSFDSKGINDTDEYRTRLATFTPDAILSGRAKK